MNTNARRTIGQIAIARFALFTLASMLLMALPAVVQAQFTYTTNNGTITITGYTGHGGDVIIPDTIDSLPVVCIGDDAFNYCGSLTNISLGNSVDRIGSGAFHFCTNLASITIPNAVTNIGDNAFVNCYNLASVTLGSGVTHIGSGAFGFCFALTNISLPESVVSIGVWAFGYCPLTSVTIPGGVTNIGVNAFDGPTLTAITVAMFNPAFSSVDGILFDKNQTTLIRYPGARAGSYTIPNGVTQLAEAAFSQCSWLTGVMIPNSVTSMRDSAFSYCTNLTQVTFGNGLTNIGNFAFFQCLGLTSLQVPQGVESIGDNALAGCFNLALFTLGNGLTRIGFGAFSDCSSLTNITIPESVNSIGDWAFLRCSSLAAITVDALNLVYCSVDGVLFDHNQAVILQCPPGRTGSYAVADTVSNIADYAFVGCVNLTNVTLGQRVVSIGGSAFHGAGLVTITIPNSVQFIGSSAFAYCTNLSGLNIPDSVTRIENDAFRFCTGLKRVTIGHGVTSLGNRAFEYCATLTNVTFGIGISYVGDRAFWACTSLTNVYFWGNAPTLGGGVFYYFPAVIHRLPGTTGWASTFGGRPTALWRLPYPVILTLPPHFGVPTDRFGFRVAWVTNRSTVVEACTNLAVSNWNPIATNFVNSAVGWFYFSDPQWTNYPSRIYRVRSQ